MVDVILPVLDEAEALPWVLDRMPAGFSPLVVDNGSLDGSAQIARSHGARVIEEPTRGFGSACFAGLVNAESDTVCFMDCDGSLDPGDLHLVADPVASGRVDLMIGARDARRGAWPLHARIGNRWLARAVRRKAGVRLKDLGPMRAAKREPLLALGLRDRRFGWPLEMVLRCAEAGWSIGGIDVPYHPRSGASKVTGTWIGTFRTARDMQKVLR